jgi:acetolactate decarboxylase
MVIKQCVRLLAIAVLASGLVACVHQGPPSKPGLLSQTSTITALLEGGYDGVTSCGELRRKGDFGIGTFDRLDGEMILIDGVIYQAKADGTVTPAPDSLTVPFAAVTRFKPTATGTVGAAPDYETLKKNLDALRPGGNLFLAVRVDGVFDYVKFRSVPAQVKPYPKLVDVAARQPVFERRFVKGSLIGFWCPEYARTLNLPGYHLHFISADRKSAGHLLDCTWQGGAVATEVISEFHLSLPQTADFQTLKLNGDSSRALKAAESGR